MTVSNDVIMGISCCGFCAYLCDVDPAANHNLRVNEAKPYMGIPDSHWERSGLLVSRQLVVLQTSTRAPFVVNDHEGLTSFRWKHAYPALPVMVAHST